MDELIAHIQEEVYWCMLFAYGIVLVYESRDGGIQNSRDIGRLLNPKALK